MSLVRNGGVYRLWKHLRRLNNHQNSPNNTQYSSKMKYSGHTWLCVENPHMYTDISIKTMCICDCETKNHVQEEKEIKKKANRKSETKFTPIRHYQENIPPYLTQKQRNQSNSRTLNADKTPKGQLLGTAQRSRQFCYGEKFLWLGVPQQTAWLQKSILSYMKEKPNI